MESSGRLEVLPRFMLQENCPRGAGWVVGVWVAGLE